MPNGWSSASCDAEQVAPEAAEMADVIGLLEARALLEQLGDAVDREQRREHQHHHQHAGDRDQHDAQRAHCGERLVTKVRNISSTAVNANWPQAAREKVSSTAIANRPSRMRRARTRRRAGR